MVQREQGVGSLSEGMVERGIEARFEPSVTSIHHEVHEERPSRWQTL